MKLITLLMTKRGDDTVRSAYDPPSPEKQTSISLHSLSIPSVRTTLMKNDFVCSQEVRVATNHARLEAINTPPQVDIYPYRNTCMHVGPPCVRTKRKLYALLARFQLFVILPTTPLLPCSSGTLTVFHTFEVPSQRSFPLRRRSVWKPWCIPAFWKAARAFLLHSFLCMNVQRSSHSVDKLEVATMIAF